MNKNKIYFRNIEMQMIQQKAMATNNFTDALMPSPQLLKSLRTPLINTSNPDTTTANPVNDLPS